MEVYILQSETTGKYYVGQCADLAKRLLRHNKGLVPSTKHGVPWKIIWNKSLETRSEVIKLEQIIKKRGAFRYLHPDSGRSSAR